MLPAARNIATYGIMDNLGKSAFRELYATV